MSQTAPDGYYVYQPDPPKPDGRIYAIGGLPYTATCKGLTKAEAQACVDALNQLATSAEPPTVLQMEELILIRECVRSLDCGELHCRYCRAGSRNQWQHSEHCPYADSVAKVERVRAILDRLQSSPVRSTPDARKEGK